MFIYCRRKATKCKMPFWELSLCITDGNEGHICTHFCCVTSELVCVFLCTCATVFEYVFYPPVTSYRDYCLAKHATDLFVIIVDCEYTPRGQGMRMKGTVREKKGALVSP